MTPVYDNSASSSASGAQTGTLAQSWSQDVAVGANNCGVVAAICSNNGSGTFVPAGSPTASMGGAALEYKGSVLLGNTNIGGFIAVWSGLLIPTGLAKAVNYSITNAGLNLANAFGLSFTYLGVGSVGPLLTAFDTAAADSVTVPSALDRLVWGLCAHYQSGAYSGDFTLTSRQNQGASVPAFIAGDGGGSASKVVSCAKSGAFAGAAVGLDLRSVIPPNRNVNQAVQAALR